MNTNKLAIGNLEQDSAFNIPVYVYEFTDNYVYFINSKLLLQVLKRENKPTNLDVIRVEMYRVGNPRVVAIARDSCKANKEFILLDKPLEDYDYAYVGDSPIDEEPMKQTEKDTNHKNCTVVWSSAMGEPFRYCRDCKVEVK